MTKAPRVVYLHGFASGPKSAKAVHVQHTLEREGLPCAVPDLNVPSFEHLRVSRAIEHVLSFIEGPTVVAGSSLGGLMALHAARRSRDVRALVLMCPALVMAERWRGALGDAALERWCRDGTLRFYNHVTNDERAVDWGFYEDLVALPALEAPRVPVRMIHGRRDEVVPLSLSEDLARAHPGVELTVVDDDHGLLAHKELVARTIVEAARGVR